MSSLKNTMDKVTKVVGEKNMTKAKQALNKEAKKASDKIGNAVSKKVKGVDADKVEQKLNTYIDKYIK